jgi:hypothetical protein
MAGSALDSGPWCDTAVLVQAQALKALGRKTEALAALSPLRKRVVKGAPPVYVYRRAMSTWVSVHELPVLERQWLRELTRGL